MVTAPNSKAIAVAIALALVAVSASSFRAQSQAQPTFKSRSEVVVVDFVVSDKADRAVRGLSAKDFVVKEDGKERPIVSFTAVDGSDGAATSAVGASSAQQTAALASTPMPTPTARPAMALLVDDGHLSPRQ